LDPEGASAKRRRVERARRTERTAHEYRGRVIEPAGARTAWARLLTAHFSGGRPGVPLQRRPRPRRRHLVGPRKQERVRNRQRACERVVPRPAGRPPPGATWRNLALLGLTSGAHSTP
jgi:hypothetical protein